MKVNPDQVRQVLVIIDAHGLEGAGLKGTRGGEGIIARVSSGVFDPVPDRILTRRFSILWLVGFSSYASVYLLIPVLPLYLQ